MKKIKLIIILIITVVLCIVTPIILNKAANQRNLKVLQQKQLEEDKQTTILNSDQVAPILILRQDKVVLYQGDELNYKSFIKEAYDNLEGDITNRVFYNKLDSNKLGEFVVEYTVSDTASNVTKAQLHVIIKEKPKFKY